jgi:exo beta-1,2-glucooligosaccharide sophorohydrolase (non-reducing end)
MVDVLEMFNDRFMIRKWILFAGFSFSLLLTAQEYPYAYNFFTNSAMQGDWFFSKTVNKGGSTIKNIDGKLPVNELVFHTPGNSLELDYRNAAGGDWQAFVYYNQKRGVDFFRKPEFLSVWLYNPDANAPEHEMPQIQLMMSDSSLSSPLMIPFLKENTWVRLKIPIRLLDNSFSGNPREIIAVVFSQRQASGGDHTIYIDDLELLPEAASPPVKNTPVIKSAKGYAMHTDIVWNAKAAVIADFVKIYRSENGVDYKPVGVKHTHYGRYNDFTGETGKKYYYRISFMNGDYAESALSSPVEVSTKAMTPDQLLTMVQEACFRYYWEGAEAESGLARENIPGRQNMVATGASGFGIMALLVGTERNFITRQESVDRFLKILAFLEKADRFHGVYPHFLDGPSGKVEPFFGSRDNGADLVETAFLIQGLLAARQYFSLDQEKERLIREKITEIWEKAEWDWFRKEPDSKFLYWHWSPDQAWVIDHPLIGWNETMIVYLLAIASPTHAVPAEMYYSGFASQDQRAQDYRKNWGGSEQGSMYANGNSYSGIKLDVGVNNGGPLFFTHYSYMGYDPHLITDKYTNYFTNNQNIAKINYNYCVANPNHYKGYGENAWGLTASDGPYDYSADEPIPLRDLGKLAPTGAISSFPYTPEESMAALKNYYYNYGHFLWGEYGFKDAFNLSENWCSEIYMGLNQAPMVVMIENYRTGLIWKLFMQNEEIREGLKKIEEAGKE